MCIVFCRIMDKRVVLFVFCVAVSMPRTAVAVTTAQTTQYQNETTTEQSTTATNAPATTTTTSPPSSTAPISTSEAANGDDDSGVGRGIGIGIGITLLVVAVVVAVLVTLLWRRGWILPCSAGASVTSLDQLSSENVKTAASPKVFSKPVSTQKDAAVEMKGYSILHMSGPQETYQPLQNDRQSQVYEDPDKAPVTPASRPVKDAKKKQPPQRSQPDGSDSSGDLYQNFKPQSHSRDGSSDAKETADQPDIKPAKKSGSEDSASSDIMRVKKSEPSDAGRDNESFYVDMSGRSFPSCSVYENTELKSS